MSPRLEGNSNRSGPPRASPPSGLYVVVSRGDESVVELLMRGTSVLQIIRRLRSMHIDDAHRLAHLMQNMIDARLIDSAGQDVATTGSGSGESLHADIQSQQVSISDTSSAQHEVIFNHDDELLGLDLSGETTASAASQHQPSASSEASHTLANGVTHTPDERSITPLNPPERIGFSNFHNFHGPDILTLTQSTVNPSSSPIPAPLTPAQPISMTLAGYRVSDPNALRYAESRAENSIFRVRRIDSVRESVVTLLEQQFEAARTQVAGLINIREAFEGIRDMAVDEEERLRIERMENAERDRRRGREQRNY